MPNETKKTILIVDDDKDLSAVLHDRFAAEGFDALTAADGEAGLALAFERHPDITLLDVLMPKMDGWKTLEKLRADEWGATARVVMLTNMSDMESVSRGMEAGSYEYLVKTDWSLAEVVQKVKSMLA